MLKLVETAVFTSIEAKMEGTWRAGLSDSEYEQIELGLAEGGVGISPMTYTQSIKNGDYTFRGVMKSRWSHTQDIIDKIKNGQIIVSDSSSRYEEVIPSTTIATLESTTTTTKISIPLITSFSGLFPLIIGFLVTIPASKCFKRLKF
jgi:basic membrane lipoprotein Med (substrate-binding protein (PBP1-ABC) superfamily)